MAIESGSRAWGFASPDSDFDVRFIYVRSTDWYLSIEDGRDVIEYPIVDDIDLNGWDIRKALRLFRKSNPAFVEWIQSPVRYLEQGGFRSAAEALLPQTFSCTRGIHHYRSMAKTNFRSYLQADSVPLKKYFYVLRPLLSVRWIEKNAAPAPIEFERLLPLLDQQSALVRDIHRLLETKRNTPELGMAPPIPTINSFIKEEFARIGSIALVEAEEMPSIEPLDGLFRATLEELCEARV